MALLLLFSHQEQIYKTKNKEKQYGKERNFSKKEEGEGRSRQKEDGTRSKNRIGKLSTSKTYLILFRIRSKKKKNRTMNGQMTIKIKRMSRIKE